MAATIVFVSLDEIAFISSWSFVNWLRKILKKIRRGRFQKVDLVSLRAFLTYNGRPCSGKDDEFIYDICAKKPIQQGM